jgi:tRNA nucleotidyltransferase/poly(A) polymerase
VSAGAGALSLEAFPPEVRATIAALAGSEGGDAWLVGGAVRDAVAGAMPGELDVAVPGGALGRGRALADRLGARFVVLDEDRGVCRLVGSVPVDLADFRAPTIDGDLAARDFTVNALAAPLGALASGRAPLRDPTGGLADLAARVVRLCGPRALDEDPVRVLRGVRLALRPGWRLDAGVAGAARAAAPGLAAVAAERMRDELARILDGPAAARGLRLLDELGALAVILPESGPMRATPQPLPHHFDVWEHSLRAVAAADRLLAEAPARLARWGQEIAARADEDLGDGLTRRAAVKLAALLHDVAKPETRTEEADGRVRFIGHDVAGAARVAGIAERWRLSRRAGALLERLVRHHLRPMHLAQSGPITRRARHRFFRDLGEDAGELLMLALADAAGLRGDDPLEVWAGEGGRVLRELQAGAAEERALAAAPPLVSGADVMAAFALSPGPAVGRLLARAREAQALGQVATREEALALLAREPAALDTPETDS